MWRLVMIAGLSLSLAACDSGNHWNLYASDDSPFSFECPGSIEGKYVGSIMTPEGVIESRFLHCNGEAGSFSVAYGELSADLLGTFNTEELLEAGLGIERMQDLKLEELSRAPVNVAGHSGLSATFIGGYDKGLTMLLQVTVIEGNLYKLSATVRTADVDSEAVRRFFDSFRCGTWSN